MEKITNKTLLSLAILISSVILTISLKEPMYLFLNVFSLVVLMIMGVDED